MSTRRPYRKSRNGCVICKQRHIKCGEEHPHCQNCIDYDAQCRYLPRPSSTTANASQVSLRAYPSASVESSPSPAPAPAASADINILDLELLHHFVTVTSLTMSNVYQEQQCWQNTMIKIGLQHSYLLRGILAISALHLCYLNPSQSIRYFVTASVHQDTSLAQFREALSSISAANFDAILAYSFLLPLSRLPTAASPRLRSHAQEIDCLSAFLDFVNLLRGVNSILLPWSDMNSSSSLMPILQIAVQDLPEATGYPGLSSLERLQSACSTFSTSTSTTSYLSTTMILTKAISQLQVTFAKFFRASKDKFTTGIILLWMLDVSNDFVLLLTKRHPSALAILAHFASLLHQENHIWWLEGLGPALITDISVLLDDEWDEVMEWPKTVANLKQPDI